MTEIPMIVDEVRHDGSGLFRVTARGAPAAIGDQAPTLTFSTNRDKLLMPGSAISVTWEPA